jgi:hypothetical protein
LSHVENKALPLMVGAGHRLVVDASIDSFHYPNPQTQPLFAVADLQTQQQNVDIEDPDFWSKMLPST